MSDVVYSNSGVRQRAKRARVVGTGIVRMKVGCSDKAGQENE
jgi:hypothetical protein